MFAFGSIAHAVGQCLCVVSDDAGAWVAAPMTGRPACCAGTDKGEPMKIHLKDFRVSQDSNLDPRPGRDGVTHFV
jgi:hypothetical protein